MHGGTDSAEWYVAALERALDVLPAEVFPAGLRPARRDRAGPRPDFAILSPISVTARAQTGMTAAYAAASSSHTSARSGPRESVATVEAAWIR